MPGYLCCYWPLNVRSRAGAGSQRGLWYGVGGFALSQILAIWVGQGSYYALITLGGYVAYRTLVAPANGRMGLRPRLVAFALNGVLVLVVGFGMAAAGLLPRLEYNSLSNLAAGYHGEEYFAVTGGWKLQDLPGLLDGDWHRIGAAALALAIIAPFVARGRHGTPFWLVLSLGALILSGRDSTPLHALLYNVLPGFSRLHPHNPERSLMIFYIGAALLAGATVSSFWDRGRQAAWLVLIPALGAANIMRSDIEVRSGTVAALILIIAVVVVQALLPRQRQLLTGVLVLVLFVDMYTAARSYIETHPSAYAKVDLNRYYQPTQASQFLRARGETEMFRYLGYDPRIGRDNTPYRWRFLDPQKRRSW